MNTPLHQLPPHAPTVPAQHDRRPSTTDQTSDRRHDGRHGAFLPTTSHAGKPARDAGPTADVVTNTAAPATEAHRSPRRHAFTAPTAGDRP